MSATVHSIRAFQQAQRFKDRPNVYRSIVRDIVAEQREGRNGFAVVHQARKALEQPQDNGPAAA